VATSVAFTFVIVSVTALPERVTPRADKPEEPSEIQGELTNEEIAAVAGGGDLPE
jgi:hypothetical protein